MDAVRHISALTRKEAADSYLASTKLTPAEKSFLIHVASYGDKNGQNIYPSVPRLSRDSGKCERQCRALLKAIRLKGHLIAVEDKHTRSVHYHIPLNQFGEVAPRPPVLSEEEAAEIENKQQKAAAKRLQAALSTIKRAIAAGELSADQWEELKDLKNMIAEHEPQTAQDDRGTVSSRQHIVALAPAAADRGEDLALEEPFLDVDTEGEELASSTGSRPPYVVMVGPGEELAGRIINLTSVPRWSMVDATGQDMPLAAGMTVSFPPQALPTTPRPSARIIDALPSPETDEAGEERASSHEELAGSDQQQERQASPLEQEIADLEKQEEDAVWLLTMRYPTKIDKRRKPIEENLKAIRSQLTALRQERICQQQEECQAVAIAADRGPEIGGTYEQHD